MYYLEKKKNLKKKIINLLPFQKLIINNYLSNISSKYIMKKEKEVFRLISLFSLANFSELLNNSIKEEKKNELLKELQKKNHIKILSKISSVYVDNPFRFGNSMVLLNNLLYYCEILNITEIYLNAEKNWPISQNFISNKINISLISGKDINSLFRNFFILEPENIYFQRVFKTEIRINYLKNEIKKNLPKIKVNSNDLFIHIRSGDIFKYKLNKNNANYAQPPLCFYQTIINNFNFTNIFIISENKENPIIDILIKKFPKIKFNKNNIELDIAILSNAYNIVGSISSFFTTLIIINDNLKNVWEFEHYMLSEKYLHLHHDIYKYPFTFSIYKMNPSLKYKTEMFPWRNSKKQIEVLLNDECENFHIIFTSKKNII